MTAGVKELDALLLDSDGLLRPHPAAVYDAIPHRLLRLWCHRHARYGLPTTELVTWLRDLIGNRPAIEVGSGSGDLAHLLPVTATDNCQQEWPDVRAFYASIGAPTVRYPNWTVRLDALDAIARFRPEVVVASWVTEWCDPNLPPPPHGGNMYGVKEDQIVASGRTYVLIGNADVHRHKAIMAQPHECHALPFVRSRAAAAHLNFVWVWNGP